MKKIKSNKIFKNYTPTEWGLSALAALFCLCSFLLFFMDGVTDEGGDGRPVYLIAFDLRVSGLHFNALAFFAYFPALICALLCFLPFKKEYLSAIWAAVMCFCAVVQMNMRAVYFLKYPKKIAEMYIAAGVVTSPYAYTACVLSILAAIVFIVKWFYPMLKRKAEVRK